MTDWKTVERFSLITEADYRNVVIFPKNSTDYMRASTDRILKSIRGRYGSVIHPICVIGAIPN